MTALTISQAIEQGYTKASNEDGIMKSLDRMGMMDIFDYPYIVTAENTISDLLMLKL